VKLEEAKEILSREDLEFKEEYERLEWRYQIGRLLAARRHELGLSQRDLAAQCGIKQPMIARIELGENISLDTFERVASSLGLDVNLVPKQTVKN